MDLIPSFSFDVSFPPFYCRLLCAQSVVPVSRVKERERENTATQYDCRGALEIVFL